MRIILLALLWILMSFRISAYEKRDLLQKSFDKNSLRNSLILNQKWVKYPGYSDRTGWDALTGSLKQEIISLSYDPSRFDAVVKVLTISDPRLSSTWGDRLFRLSLNAKQLITKGKYRFIVERE